MPISDPELASAAATAVLVTDADLSVELADGRTIVVPLLWYPRLGHATDAERGNWRLIGLGAGIEWPDVEEDISVESLLAGRRSAETAQSLQRWLAGRSKTA